MINNFGSRKKIFSLLNISNSKLLSVGVLVTCITLTGCLLENTSKSGVEKKDSDEEFEPTIESLKNYVVPEWFRDAKLGIYLHWGVYSVAEQGEWYPRDLYREDQTEYLHHLKTYGHPSEFGYKDLIPLWKAENFDPDKLVKLFKKAGARYFTPVAVHHDNFDLWDSKHHQWNAVNMGPKKDIIGMWRKATLDNGLRFGVTTHLSRSYSWLNTAKGSDSTGPFKGVPYDGNNPEFESFYHQKHDDTHFDSPESPPKEWKENWKRRMIDLIDNYQPDLLYFDCAIPFKGEDAGKTGMEVIAHHYNTNIRNHGGLLEGVMAIKPRPWQGVYIDGVATMDIERGKASHIIDTPWQTDDSVAPWDWGYRKNDWLHVESGEIRTVEYMDANMVIDKFLDIVSKNGNLLLNVLIRADGTLDEKTIVLLEQMGEWLDQNGEAIYGSRPWHVFGEMFGKGKVNEFDMHANRSPFTSKDVRYTTNNDNLYAMVMDWPGANKKVRLQHVTPTYAVIEPVKSVQILGYDGEVSWEQTGRGLYVTMPKTPPNDIAIAIKIGF